MPEETIPLREHWAIIRTIDQQHAQEVRDDDQRAVTTALQTVEKQRIEDRETDRAYRAAQNEWRGQSKDQAGTYATRSEVELMFRNRTTDDFAAKAGSRSNSTLVLGSIMAFVTIANILALWLTR